MRKKYFNNLITSLLIISFVLVPYFGAIQKTEAANISVNSKFSFSSLPQCSSVSMTTKLLFTGAMATLGSAIKGEDIGTTLGSAALSTGAEYLKGKVMDKLEDKAKQAISSIDSVNVNIEGTATADKITDIKEKTDKTQKDVSALKDNDTCTAAIGRIVIKMLLQKLTVSTVNWINSGFDGSPSFIQDPGKFFGDIAKNEILQFNSEIIASGSPFGSDWIKNQALAYNKKFADNARYSLNELIQNTTPEYSASTFQADFSQGGWNAWTAMTQVPANNPLGFKLMADNEMQKRLEGTVQSTAQNVRNALQEANGFLGDQRCADPKGVTREEHEKGLIERSNRPQNKPDEMQYVYANRVCNKWEYVTPGSMIATAATETMKDTKDSYLNVKDLNDAIAAVLDALLAQFSSSVMEKGFADLSSEDFNGSSSYNSSDDDSYRTQTENDFTPTQLTSSWLQANPDFNIRTDLTQALIDEQRTYSDKLALQNKELLSTDDGDIYRLAEDGLSSNAYGLIPVIHQLDYCIPGPHPGWEEDSRETLAKTMDEISSQTKESLKDNTRAFIKEYLLVTDAAGDAFDFITGKDDYTQVRQYYSAIIKTIIGYRPNPESNSDQTAINLQSKEAVDIVLNQILDRYAAFINNIYNPDLPDSEMLPVVTKEAANKFNKLNGYNQMLKNNENEIISFKVVVNTLTEIKKTIDNLNMEYKDSNGQFKSDKPEEEYEDKLKTQINAFGRMSSKMVNGDDIANVDNLTKQIIDEKNYIYKDLLKGPYGCEKELEQKPNGEFLLQFYNTKRMTYPFPILYDYNKIATGTNIPDPWGSGFKENKIKSDTSDKAQGPGFLSNLTFQIENSGANDQLRINGFCKGAPESIYNLGCQILLRDLLPLEADLVTLGKHLMTPLEYEINDDRNHFPYILTDGVFEKKLGVY